MRASSVPRSWGGRGGCILQLAAVLFVFCEGVRAYCSTCNASTFHVCALATPDYLDATIAPALRKANEDIANDVSLNRKVQISIFNAGEAALASVATVQHNLASCACSAIIGAYYSIVSQEVGALAGHAGFTQISYASTSPNLSDRSRFPRFFRVIPPSVQFAQSVAAMVAHFPTYTSVALVIQTDDYGRFGGEALVEALAAKNISVLQQLSLSGGGDTYPAATALKKSKLRVFVTFLYQDVLHNLLSDAGSIGLTSSQYVWIGGDDTEPALLSSFLQTSLASAGGEWVTELNMLVLEWPQVPQIVPNATFYAAKAYDAAMVLARAFDSLSSAQAATACLPGTATNDVMKDAIKRVQLEGLGGAVRFDADGEFSETVSFDMSLLSSSSRVCGLAGLATVPCVQPLGTASSVGTSWVAERVLWADASESAPSGNIAQRPAESCQTARKRGDITVLVVTHGTAASGFWNDPDSGVVKGLRAAVADSRANVIYQDDAWLQGDAAQMATYIQSRLRRTPLPDVLVTSIPDPAVMKEAIQEAARLGVRVYGVNAGLSVSVGPNAWREGGMAAIQAFVGNDEEEAGYVGASLLVKGGARNGILFVNHEPPTESLMARAMGVARFAALGTLGNPLEFWMLCVGGGCEAYGMCAGGTCAVGELCTCMVDSRPFADVLAAQDLSRLIASILSDGGASIDAVFTGAQDAVSSAVTAIESFQSEIVLGTFDLGTASFAAIDAGELLFAIHQDQFMQGYMPIMVGVMAISKRQSPSLQHYKTGPVVIDKNNLDNYRCFVDKEFCKTGQDEGETLEDVANIAAVTHASPGFFWGQVLEGLTQGVVDTRIQVDTSHFFNFDDCERMIESYHKVLEGGGVDALITSFQCMSLREPLIEIVKKYRIPVVLINTGSREADQFLRGDEDEDVARMFLHYIGQDDFVAGQELAKQMLADGAEEVSIFLSSYTRKSAADRHNGIMSVLEGRVPYTAIAVQDDLNIDYKDADQVMLYQIVASELRRSHTINSVFFEIFNKVSPAILAIKELSRPIRLYTFDKSTEIMDAVYDGDIAQTVNQGPYSQGYMPILSLVAYLRSRSQLPQFSIYTGPAMIDERTVDEAYLAGQISGCVASICPPGSYLKALDCQPCPAGTFQPTGKAMSLSDCLPCPGGTHQPEEGAGDPEACLPCQPGQFSRPGAGQCSDCPAGRAYCPLAVGTPEFESREAMHVLYQDPDPEEKPWDPIIVLWVGLGIAGTIWLVGFSLLFCCSRVGVLGEKTNGALQWLARRDDFGLEELDEDANGRITVDELMNKGISRPQAEALMEQYDKNRNGELEGAEIADFMKPKVAAGILCFGLLIGALSYLLWFIVSWIVSRVEYEALVPMNDEESQTWPAIPMTIKIVFFGAMQVFNKEKQMFECRSLGLRVVTDQEEGFKNVAVTWKSLNNHSCEVTWSTTDFSKYPTARIAYEARGAYGAMHACSAMLSTYVADRTWHQINTNPHPEFLNGISWQILMPKYDRVDADRDAMQTMANKSLLAAEGAVFRGQRSGKLDFNLFRSEFTDNVNGKTNKGAVLQPISQFGGEEAACPSVLPGDEDAVRTQKLQACLAAFRSKDNAMLEVRFTWSVLKLTKQRDRQSGVLSLVAEGGGNLGLFINSPPTLMGIVGYFFAAAIAWCGSKFGSKQLNSPRGVAGDDDATVPRGGLPAFETKQGGPPTAPDADGKKSITGPGHADLEAFGDSRGPAAGVEASCARSRTSNDGRRRSSNEGAAARAVEYARSHTSHNRGHRDSHSSVATANEASPRYQSTAPSDYRV